MHVRMHTYTQARVQTINFYTAFTNSISSVWGGIWGGIWVVFGGIRGHFGGIWGIRGRPNHYVCSVELGTTDPYYNIKKEEEVCGVRAGPTACFHQPAS